MTHKTCDKCSSDKFVGTYKVPPQSFLGYTTELFGDLHFQAPYDFDLTKIHVIDLCAECRKLIDQQYTNSFAELISKTRKDYTR